MTELLLRLRRIHSHLVRSNPDPIEARRLPKPFFFMPSCGAGADMLLPVFAVGGPAELDFCVPFADMRTSYKIQVSACDLIAEVDMEFYSFLTGHEREYESF